MNSSGAGKGEGPEDVERGSDAPASVGRGLAPRRKPEYISSRFTPARPTSHRYGMDCVLFVHIPKTAGTSFRKAAEQFFEGRIAWDYGPQVEETSGFLVRPPHSERDLELIRRELESRNIRLLGGHLKYREYAPLFPPERVIAFVRDPVERMVSEYFHVVRKSKIRGSLLEVARRPHNRNRQTKMLHGAPLEEIGVLGVLERYQDSLELVRERFDWDLPRLEFNLNPTRRRLAEGYDVTPEEAEELQSINAEDVALYERAVTLLDEAILKSRRRAEAEKGHTVDVGAVDVYRGGDVVGWAAIDEGRFDAQVVVRVDGQILATVRADRFRRDLLERGVHRTGLGGFRARVGELPVGTRIHCSIRGSHRELANSPLVVSASTDEA